MLVQGENEVVQVRARFEPWPGLYSAFSAYYLNVGLTDLIVFHCHNLIHEDHDMLAAFNVTGEDETIPRWLILSKPLASQICLPTSATPSSINSPIRWMLVSRRNRVWVLGAWQAFRTRSFRRCLLLVHTITPQQSLRLFALTGRRTNQDSRIG